MTDSSMEFIGTVRRRLFIDEPHEWNGVVRDVTAKMECPGKLVDAEQVCKFIVRFYRERAHWARFRQEVSGND
jgi:hypothetical protein